MMAGWGYDGNIVDQPTLIGYSGDEYGCINGIKWI